jgi:hypothetical protein
VDVSKEQIRMSANILLVLEKRHTRHISIPSKLHRKFPVRNRHSQIARRVFWWIQKDQEDPEDRAPDRHMVVESVEFPKEATSVHTRSRRARRRRPRSHVQYVDAAGETTMITPFVRTNQRKEITGMRVSRKCIERRSVDQDTCWKHEKEMAFVSVCEGVDWFFTQRSAVKQKNK